MGRYAEYLRKSRADNPQETLEETLSKHRKALAESMASYGISVAGEDVYEEVVSGDSLYSRPQMLRLMEAVEAGKYDGVLCMDIQRLGRGSMSDQGAILDAFKYSGTKIITPLKVYDLSDDTDETYTEFETFMGRQEYKMIRRRLQRGIKSTVLEGGYIPNAPYGYEKVRIGKKPSLRIVESEACFVRMMFDLYEGGTGCQTIADRVNALGAKPRRGEAFGRTGIRFILKNAVYTGKVVWDKKSHIRPHKRGNDKHMVIYHPKAEWTVTDGIHPAIISEEQFEHVQEIFSGRYHSPSFTGVIENSLAGLVVCANCGKHMQRQADARMGALLLCTKRGCIVSSKLSMVEAQVILQLREEMGRLLAKGDSQKNRKQDNGEELVKGLEKQISVAKKQDEKLHDLLEQGIYDNETFLNRHAALVERIKRLETTKANIRPQKIVDIPRMVERIQGVLDKYNTCGPHERNALLKTVIEKVVYKKEKGAMPADFHLEVFLLPIYL